MVGAIARVTRVDHWVQWPLTRETQTAALHHCRPRLQTLSLCEALSDNTDKPRATSSIQIWYDIFLHHNISIQIHQRFINPWHDVCLRCLVGFNQFTSLRQTINKIWPKEYHSLMSGRLQSRWILCSCWGQDWVRHLECQDPGWCCNPKSKYLNYCHISLSRPPAWLVHGWNLANYFSAAENLTFRILSGNVLLPWDPVVLWVSVFAPGDGDWI